MSTFEVVSGVEGDCLVLDGTRIAGPKPWGGGRIIKEWHTTETYVNAATVGSDEPPYDELIDALRRDWDIDVSWDGLRKFWSIALTDEGVKKRGAATVGTGTCHITLREDIHDGAYHDVYECSRCGEQMSVGTVMGKSEPPNFCIRCGGSRIEVSV